MIFHTENASTRNSSGIKGHALHHTPRTLQYVALSTAAWSRQSHVFRNCWLRITLENVQKGISRSAIFVEIKEFSRYIV